MIEVVKDSFKEAFSKKITYVALIGIPLIVGLFGFSYVYTYMDPIENMQELPVAIVNLDQGSYVGEESENFGEHLMDSIMENDAVLWTEETPNLVDEGLDTSDYYMAVVIPSDFSEKVVKGQTSEPDQADIVFYKNMRKNFMMATLSSQIEGELENMVNQEISKQYTSALVEGLLDSQLGLSDAASGAAMLADGADSITEALSSAQEGSSSLLAGAEGMSSGAEVLLPGTEALYKGTLELESQTSSLPAGVSSLKQGIDAVSDGTVNAQNGATAISQGLSNLAAGCDAIKEHLAEISVLSDKAAAGVVIAASASDSVVENSASATAEIIEAIGLLDPVNDAQAIATLQDAAQKSSASEQYALEISRGLLNDPSGDNVYSSVLEIAEFAAGIDYAVGHNQDAESDQTLLGSINALKAGADSLEDGLRSAQIALTQLSGGTVSLYEGSTNLSAAASSLASGSGSVVDGVSVLENGAAQLTTGLSGLSQGLEEIASGGDELNGGAEELTDKLSEGSNGISSSLTTDAVTFADYLAHPVEVGEEIHGDLDHFGYGFVPLFTTLCLWLGSLLIFFILSPFPSLKLSDSGRFSSVLGRWPAYLVFSAFEVGVVFLCSVGLGVPYSASPEFLLFVFIISISFISIMQFLNSFGVVGKAIAMILVALQLVCCSGMFPAEIGRDYASAVGTWLPFTYAIDGIRELMSGGASPILFNNIGALLIFALGALLCSFVFYPATLKMKLKHDKDTAKELSECSAKTEQASKAQRNLHDLPLFFSHHADRKRP